MRFYVTAKDIREGCVRDAFSCPIALSVKRRTRDLPSVTWRTLKAKGRTFDLPNTAKFFVRSFDCKKPVKPFRFTIPNL